MTEINRKIHIVGINSFEFEDLPSKLQNLFNESINIAIPNLYFDEIKSWGKYNLKKKKLFYSSQSDKKLIHWLKSQTSDVILISRGDPLWFGIGRILLENFSEEELRFYPTNTCIQQAFSKLKKPWQDTQVVSIHGRDSTRLIEVLKAKPSSLAIITDSKNKSLEIIQKNLFELGLNYFYEFWICEELGLKDEKIRKLNIEEKLPLEISNLNIVVLLKIESDEQNYISQFGLKDDAFITFEDRPNLLTKREVRVQILADLELPEKGIICDIGAGCGSIGLESLRLRPNLKLFCIDKKIGSKNLISKNAVRLAVTPEKIFEEDINLLLNSPHNDFLKIANRVVIGGCDKKTKLVIINQLSHYMRCGDIIVIPIIDIETVKSLRDALKENNFRVDLNLIQTYKSLTISEGIRLEPNNPVFLLKGKKFPK